MSSFKYLIFVDFEATCWGGYRTRETDMEIIEFPAVLLNTTTGQIESEFHKFVRPTRFPTLSEYCINLTGITQSFIDQQDTFPTVFGQFLKWLSDITVAKGLNFAKRNDCAGKNATFCSWTVWDFKVFLAQDCRKHKVKMPEEMKNFIDIRYVFRGKYDNIQLKFPEALKFLNVPATGSDHSGIDDAKNLAKLAMAMIAKGHVLNKTTCYLP